MLPRCKQTPSPRSRRLDLPAIWIPAVNLEIAFWNLMPFSRPGFPMIVAELVDKMPQAIHAPLESILVGGLVFDYLPDIAGVVVVENINPPGIGP